MISYSTEPRRDRLLRERNHDPYKIVTKLVAPVVCSRCNAVLKHGLWQWLDVWPLEAQRVICPACRRVRDHYPAGLVTITGDFVKTHKREVINLARNQETAERSRHPLNRIINIAEQNGRLAVSTTDIHLPRRIGQALRRAYKGVLEVHYEKAACLVRVNWTSPEDKQTNDKKRRKL